MVLIIPAPLKAISQPITLNDGGRDRLDEAQPASPGMRMHANASEEEGVLHNAHPPPPLFTHVQHVTESRKNPPEQNICQPGYVALFVTHTHTQLLTPTVRPWKSTLALYKNAHPSNTPD